MSDSTPSPVAAAGAHAIPEALVVDARAKITWGESPEKILAFLQLKSVSDKDALALIEELMQERAASIRADGIKQTWIAALCVLAPFAYYFTIIFIGYWSMKFFAALIVLGVYGLVKVTTGLSMVLKPRSVAGDLANGDS